MMEFDTLSEAYLGLLETTLNTPDFICAPRGQKVLEILDVQYRVLYPTFDPIVTADTDRNKIIADYTKKELDWYLSGEISAASAPSKFWLKLADQNGNITSNYGYQALYDDSEGNSLEGQQRRTPYEWAVQSLRADKDSRQALMRINKPSHAWVGNKDFTCTISVMAMIRENKLHFSVVQRSCDLQRGLVYDSPWWIWLQYKMVIDLRSTYPELQVGWYTHTIHSCHIYAKDIDTIKRMLGEIGT